MANCVETLSSWKYHCSCCIHSKLQEEVSYQFQMLSTCILVKCLVITTTFTHLTFKLAPPRSCQGPLICSPCSWCWSPLPNTLPQTRAGPRGCQSQSHPGTSVWTLERPGPRGPPARPTSCNNTDEIAVTLSNNETRLPSLFPLNNHQSRASD